MHVISEILEPWADAVEDTVSPGGSAGGIVELNQDGTTALNQDGTPQVPMDG